MANPNEDNMVPRSAACPKCGERDVDHLELHEDDTVDCLTCKTTYSIVPITP